MKPRLVLSLLALLAFSHIAHAELVFDISEEIVSPTQTNLLITASGSVDTDGLTFHSNGFTSFSIFTPGIASITIHNTNSFSFYSLPVALTSFGTSSTDLVFANLSGHTIVIDNALLGVPFNYISESPLEASMTVVDRNFDDLSLIAGESYSVSWAVGTADEDSLTVNIVPEPSSILLIGTASGLLALARQKRKTRCVH